MIPWEPWALWGSGILQSLLLKSLHSVSIVLSFPRSWESLLLAYFCPLLKLWGSNTLVAEAVLVDSAESHAWRKRRQVGLLGCQLRLWHELRQGPSRRVLRNHYFTVLGKLRWVGGLGDRTWENPFCRACHQSWEVTSETLCIHSSKGLSPAVHGPGYSFI